MEPAVAPRLGGRCLVFKVAGKETALRVGARLAHQELLGARNDLNVQARRWHADAARADMARLAAGGDQRAAAGLGHRPGLDQRKAEARLEGGVVLRVGVRTVAEAHAMRAVVSARLELQQDRGHHAEIVDDRGARVDDVAPPGFGVKAVELHHAAGGEDHRRGRHGERVHVKQRQRRDEPLFAMLQRAKAAFVDVALAHVQEIEVAEQAAFGLPRGARGIEQRAFGGGAGLRRLRQVHAFCHGQIDDQRRFAMRQHVLELAPLVIRIHRHHGDAEGVEREEVQQEVRAVRQLERDAMAARVPLPGIRARDFGDALLCLRIAELEFLRIELQERLRTVRAGGLLERREDGRHRTGW